MAFCTKCGTQVEDNTKFCTKCGAPIGDAANQANQTQNATNQNQGYDFSDKISKLNDTADRTAEFDKEDIENNKLMGILAYLSWLVLIPLFAAPKSRFARFHTNQGLVLAIIEIIWWIASALLGGIFSLIKLYFIISILSSIVNLAFFVLLIIGIVNVVNGKAKELPVIGNIKVIKY